MKSGITSCLVALCIVGLSTPFSSADTITVDYSGYGHTGLASQPAAGTSFDTGNTETFLETSSSNSGTVTTSDGEVTTDHSLALTFAGSGSSLLTADSNLTSVSTVTGSSGNKQVDTNYYRYIGFSVDETGNYTFSGVLSTFAVSNTTGYHYYGLGGDTRIDDLSGGTATTIYSYDGVGNVGDPGADTVADSFSTTLNLTAGVQYQLNFGSYQYSGFNDPGTAEVNSGWDVQLQFTAIPEPSAMFAVTLLGFAGLARRKRI